MELLFLLAAVIAIAIIYDQYWSADNDALDRFGKPLRKGGQRPSAKHPGKSSSQFSRKHRTGKTA